MSAFQLPKYKKIIYRRPKVCQEPGCNKQFFGHPVAKYCEKHRDIKNRQKTAKKEKVDSGADNMIINHDLKSGYEERIFNCSLYGCPNSFIIRILPKQYVYPKYCEEHRNEYRRMLYIKKMKWLT